VLPMFRYVVETEKALLPGQRRSYGGPGRGAPHLLRSEVGRRLGVGTCTAPLVFVSSVRVVTFKDVNVEELPEKDL